MKTAKPDRLLAAGLACAVLGAGLSQFVIIGLIGVALFFIAFGLLLWAGICAPTATGFPQWQRIGGAALYIAGVVLLLTLAGYASSLAYDQVVSPRFHRTAPSEHQWITLGLSSLVPVPMIMIGLRFWTQWSRHRCSVWGGTALCVVPAALLLFWLFAKILPLST